MKKRKTIESTVEASSVHVDKESNDDAHDYFNENDSDDNNFNDEGNNDDPNFNDDTKSPLYKTISINKTNVKIKWCSVS